ncbi:MAG: hypothetical protein ABJE95_02405 [Byssovorax sp.]
MNRFKASVLRWRLLAPSAIAIVMTCLVLTSCASILGLDDFKEVAAASGGGAGGATGTSTTSTVTSTATGEGGSMCTPGATKACYEGPQGTENMGVCKSGKKTCKDDALSYGPCADQVTPSTETCADTADENCDGHDCVLSSKSFGDASNQSIAAVTTDASGNVLIAGIFGGAVDFGNGPMISDTTQDVFLAKFDATGKIIWSLHFSSNGSVTATGLTTDAMGNCAIVGYFSGDMSLAGSSLSTFAGDSDIYAAKVDPDGKFKWARRLGSKQLDVPRAVATTSNADIIITGAFQETADFGAGTLTNSTPGLNDILLLKLDGSDGHTVWSKGFGSSSEEEGFSVAVDKNDNIVLTGNYVDKALNLGGSDLAPIGPGKEATFYAKFDKSGNHIWSYRLGAASPGIVRISQADDIILTATYYASLDLGINTIANNGGADLLVAKSGPGGSFTWAYGFGGPGNDSGSLAVDAAGGITLAMNFQQEMLLGVDKLVSAGGFDIALARLNSAGNFLWTRRFGGPGNESALPAASLLSGESILAGGMDESFDFGDGPLVFKGGQDMFLARFAP